MNDSGLDVTPKSAPANNAESDSTLPAVDSTTAPRTWSDVSRDAYDAMKRGEPLTAASELVVKGGQLVFDSIFGPKKPDLPSPGTLKTVMSNYPGLDQHIRPGAISALIENETLNIRNDWKDKPEEWAVSLLSNLRRTLGKGNATDYFCTNGDTNILQKIGDPMINRIKPGLGVRNISIGPGQMQIDNICALRANDTYGGTRHSLESSLTVDGAADLVGGYLRREVDRFTRKDFKGSNGEALTYHQFQAQNPNLRPEVRERYSRMQELWNQGTTTPGQEGMRMRELALLWSYNPGVGRSGAQKIQDKYVR
ncbi:MAG: hypothetical protein KIT34_18255 [Cyanobacteria bacterium TGS_CYA1]|nr:hypothetical protein [Cyanobacteria bacterium TGS_CYA1]